MRNNSYSWKYELYFLFKQKTTYEMRIRDWSSDVCSSDLAHFNPLIIAILFIGKQQGGGIVMFAPSRRYFHEALDFGLEHRSEESRVGKECVSTCRSR